MAAVGSDSMKSTLNSQYLDSDFSLLAVATNPNPGDDHGDCSQRPHRRDENVKEHSSRPPGTDGQYEDDSLMFDSAGPQLRDARCRPHRRRDQVPQHSTSSSCVHSSWYQEVSSSSSDTEHDENLYCRIADDYTALCREVKLLAANGYAMSSRSSSSASPSANLSTSTSDHSQFSDASLYYFLSHESDGGLPFSAEAEKLGFRIHRWGVDGDAIKDLDQVEWLRRKLELKTKAKARHLIAVLLTPPSESFQNYVYRNHTGDGRYGRKDVDRTFKEGVRTETLYHERAAEMFAWCAEAGVPATLHLPCSWETVDQMPLTDAMRNALEKAHMTNMIPGISFVATTASLYSNGKVSYAVDLVKPIVSGLAHAMHGKRSMQATRVINSAHFEAIDLPNDSEEDHDHIDGEPLIGHRSYNGTLKIAWR